MYLYQIGMIDRLTGEKTNLKVFADNTDAATRKATSMGLFGTNGPYRWTSTDPLYKNNKLISDLS